MITTYSFFSAVLFCNFALVMVYILMRRTKFVIKYTVSALGMLSLLAIVRLVAPVDLDIAIVIRSDHAIPAIKNFLDSPIPGIKLTVGMALIIVWSLGALGYLLYDARLYALQIRAERSLEYFESEDVNELAKGLGIKCPVKISSQIP